MAAACGSDPSTRRWCPTSTPVSSAPAGRRPEGAGRPWTTFFLCVRPAVRTGGRHSHPGVPSRRAPPPGRAPPPPALPASRGGVRSAAPRVGTSCAAAGAGSGPFRRVSIPRAPGTRSSPGRAAPGPFLLLPALRPASPLQPGAGGVTASPSQLEKCASRGACPGTGWPAAVLGPICKCMCIFFYVFSFGRKGL